MRKIFFYSFVFLCVGANGMQSIKRDVHNFIITRSNAQITSNVQKMEQIMEETNLTGKDIYLVYCLIDNKLTDKEYKIIANGIIKLLEESFKKYSISENDGKFLICYITHQYLDQIQITKKKCEQLSKTPNPKFVVDESDFLRKLRTGEITFTDRIFLESINLQDLITGEQLFQFIPTPGNESVVPTWLDKKIAVSKRIKELEEALRSQINNTEIDLRTKIISEEEIAKFSKMLNPKFIIDSSKAPDVLTFQIRDPENQPIYHYIPTSGNESATLTIEDEIIAVAIYISQQREKLLKVSNTKQKKKKTKKPKQTQLQVNQQTFVESQTPVEPPLMPVEPQMPVVNQNNKNEIDEMDSVPPLEKINYTNPLQKGFGYKDDLQSLNTAYILAQLNKPYIQHNDIETQTTPTLSTTIFTQRICTPTEVIEAIHAKYNVID